MKIKRSQIGFFVAVLLGCFICMLGCSSSSGGGSGVGNISGTIDDLNYNPLSSIDVVVDSSATKTLSNGIYSFINIPAGSKLIKMSSSNYTSAYRRLSLGGGSSVVADIVFLAHLDTKTTPITIASGGTATNTNGSIKVVFKPNAFSGSGTKNVILTAAPKIAAPYNPPESYQFVSYIVYAKPDETLLVSSELTVPNLTGTTQEVSFYRFNPDSYSWEWFAIGIASNITKTITVETPYLGWIAAIMKITPNPGTITGTVTQNGPGTPVVNANVWTQSSYAVTNSFGQYTLTYIPVGVATVFASALNYNPYSGTTSVESDKTTTYNFKMDQVPQGNISGRVNSNFYGYISGIRVVETYGAETYTDTYGNFTLYNLPTSRVTDVTAYAPAHNSATVANVSVPSSNVNLTLSYTGTVNYYNYTFEGTDECFTATGQWHLQNSTDTKLNYFNSAHGGITKKVALPDTGYTPSAHGGNYYFWYGQATPATVEASYIGEQDSSDTFEASGGISTLFYNNFGTLESPMIDLSGYSKGTLSFWTWWEIEGKNPATGYDQMQILISKSPFSTWTSLGYLNPFDDPDKTLAQSAESYTSGGYYQPGTWVQHNLDITPYVGGYVKIKFYFDTKDTLYNGYRGWFIDDINITSESGGLFSVNSLRPYIDTIPRN